MHDHNSITLIKGHINYANVKESLIAKIESLKLSNIGEFVNSKDFRKSKYYDDKVVKYIAYSLSIAPVFRSKGNKKLKKLIPKHEIKTFGDDIYIKFDHQNIKYYIGHRTLLEKYIKVEVINFNQSIHGS